MSTFLALNLEVDTAATKKDLEEEHTREIQIEEAFKIFQRALDLQKKEKYVEAYHEYENLFKLEVILNHYYEEEIYIKGLQNGGANGVVDELTFLSPNVKKLRYLVFRNRGFLYYHIMKAQVDVSKLDKKGLENEFERYKQIFYSLIDDLLICFLYQEADEETLLLLQLIFSYLGLLRLERYTLEYELASEESQDFLAFFPRDKGTERKTALFLQKLSGESSSFLFDENLAFLEPLRKDLKELIRKSQNITKLCIQAPQKSKLTWSSVLEAINVSVKQLIDKEKALEVGKLKPKGLDQYLITEEPIERVFFQLPSDSIDKKAPEELGGKERQNYEKEGYCSDDMDVEVKQDVEEVTTVETTSDETKDPSKKIRNEDINNENISGGAVIQKRSSRFRNEAEQEVKLVKELFSETTRFFSAMKTHFKTIKVEIDDVVPMFIDNEDDIRNGEKNADLNSRFMDLLKNHEGNPFKSLISTKNKGEVEKQKLLDILTSFELGERASDKEVKESSISCKDIWNILQSLNEANLSYKSYKNKILEHLITNEFHNLWDFKLTSSVKDWIQQCESDLLENMKRDVSNGDLTYFNFEFALGVYELLLDNFMNLRNQLTTLRRSKGNKNTIGALQVKGIQLRDKISRWSIFLDSIFDTTNVAITEANQSIYRYKWISTFKERAFGDPYEGKLISELLSSLLNSLKSNNEVEIFVNFCNCDNILNLTLKNVETRLNTTEILSVFAKILDNTGVSSESQKMLEEILVKKDVSNKTTESIIRFLDSAHVEIKLTLWNILFSFYLEDNNLDMLQKGFEHFLQFILEHLEEENNLKSDMLLVLAYYGNYLTTILHKFKENAWQLKKSPLRKQALVNIIKIFRLFYLFSLHEEGAIITSTRRSIQETSSDAFDTLKDILVNSASLLFLYFKDLSKSKNESYQLIVLLHDHLGLRQLCDCGDGLFLTLVQDSLTSLKQQRGVDVMQVIACRYHLNINLNGISPTNHYTKVTANLDLDSLLELSGIVLPICFESNPVIHPPKNEMRTVIEEFYEVVGDANVELDNDLQKNNQLLEYFLGSTYLTPMFLRHSFHGLVNSGLSRESNERYQLIQDGLYFLQALLVFNLYKIRKKLMQSRAVELENVIHLLKLDLIFGSNRVESWFLLGQAYSFLVEDDLIWTSDKLIFPDRKTSTANIQRKALLCYFMSVNEVLRQDTSKEIFCLIMGQLAKEMYNATMKPMDMHAFKVIQNPRFIRKESGASFVTVAENSYTKRVLCCRIIQQALNLSIKGDAKAWSPYYYLLKIQKKLNLEPDTIIRTLLLSLDLARESLNLQDPIIEPHYRLCSLLYKFVKEEVLVPVIACHYLKKDQLFSTIDTGGVHTREEFYKVIIECLKKLIAYDKKKWHHKPKYRLGQILFQEFKDTEGAKEEMSGIISLKVTNKTLVLIWKPENERPGKHFLYTYQYAMFYIELLYVEKNLSSLILMLPKLRRSNSTMVSLPKAWEFLCMSLCKVMRQLLKVTESFTENFLMYLSFQKFLSNSKAMNERIVNPEDGKIDEDFQIYACYLYSISDMKKLNNGYGPTSLIDDTLVSVYITAYVAFTKKWDLNTAPEIVELPPAKTKRLAKRDVFPLTSELLKNCKKGIEDLLKDDPDIHNVLIARATKKNEEELEERIKNEAKSNQTPLPEDGPYKIHSPVIFSPEQDKQNDTQNGFDSQDTQVDKELGKKSLADKELVEATLETNGTNGHEVIEIDDSPTKPYRAGSILHEREPSPTPKRQKIDTGEKEEPPKSIEVIDVDGEDDGAGTIDNDNNKNQDIVTIE